MKINTAKKFDCIKMKETIQAHIYTETEGMSNEEVLDYFNNSCSNFSNYERANNFSAKNERKMENMQEREFV
jgi:hypothetical protein